MTLHSFDFTKYRLWTSLFRRGTIVNGQIVVCSFDLTEYWEVQCFVLISMVLRHWSSRLALRPASNFVSSYIFFWFAAISITLRP